MSKEEKYKRNMKCLDKWLSVYEKGNYIVDYLKHCKIESIGIYGYGILGKHLVYELQKKKFPIQWVMDKSSSGDEVYDQIISLNEWENQKDVDVAIITTLTDLEEIEFFLIKFVTGQIISIEELIDRMYCWGFQR